MSHLHCNTPALAGDARERSAAHTCPGGRCQGVLREEAKRRQSNLHFCAGIACHRRRRGIAATHAAQSSGFDTLRYSTLVAMTLLLVACLPTVSTFATETPQPSVTPIPTETIVWFPPSPTATDLSVPTYTGTPDMSPGIGRVTLEDDFSDDEVWDTARSDNGSAVITRNRLTLSVKPGYYLSSMRRELPLSDFYAEITARPSLCRGEDNYGLIIRGVGSSFYRFLLNCNGMVWAERISGGTKLGIQEPVASGDAPPGAPGEVRIGMWAVGNEMRLFLNDRFQFSVSDPVFPIGALGVFVRSNGETPATILFSELEVYDVNYTPPTKTPIPPTPTP